MEWTVVTVIIALVGLICTVSKPIVSLTRSITQLIGAVDNLKTDLSEAMNKNHESHGRIWDHNKIQDERLSDHDIRIVKLEGK